MREKNTVATLKILHSKNKTKSSTFVGKYKESVYFWLLFLKYLKTTKVEHIYMTNNNSKFNDITI